MPETSANLDISQSKARWRGRIFLMISAIFFALYLANVLVGKWAIMSGSTNPFDIGDVAEFLLLFLASVNFVIAILQFEIAEGKAPSK